MRRVRNHAETGGGTGSLDMLLDTMCNTFGGVCFIALLVALISSALPKAVGTDEEHDVQKLLADERLARLARERDEAESAVVLWEELLAEGEDGSVADVAAVEGDLEALRARATLLEEEIRKRATDREYNRREAERLRLLAEELKRKLAEESERRKRQVRTPMEHEMAGWSPVDVWLRHGRLHVLDNPSHARVRTEGAGEWRTWTYRTAGDGWEVGGSLWRSPGWREIEAELRGMRFLRIYSDRESFGELCEIRDRLIAAGARYNWHWTEEDELVFSVGRDERVQ